MPFSAGGPGDIIARLLGAEATPTRSARNKFSQGAELFHRPSELRLYVRSAEPNAFYHLVAVAADDHLKDLTLTWRQRRNARANDIVRLPQVNQLGMTRNRFFNRSTKLVNVIGLIRT